TEFAAGPYTITSATFAGVVVQFVGASPITIQNATMLDAAHFLGAGFVGAPNSLLDVAGVLQANCSAPVTTPPTGINVRPQWLSDSSWQPAAGKVVCTGSSGVTATVAANTHWAGLEIESQFGLNVIGDLYVNGALRVRGHTTVSGTTIELGAQAGISLGTDLTGSSVTTPRIHNGLQSAGALTTPNATL